MVADKYHKELMEARRAIMQGKDRITVELPTGKLISLQLSERENWPDSRTELTIEARCGDLVNVSKYAFSDLLRHSREYWLGIIADKAMDDMSNLIHAMENPSSVPELMPKEYGSW